MGIQNYLELSYHFENNGNGLIDNFSSKFDLNKEFSVGELAVFLKLFFYKISFMDKKVIDYIIPFPIRPLSENMKYEEENKEENEEDNNLKSYLNSLTDDVDKIVNNKENIDHFKKQIQENPEMLKEAFKSFLKDTLD